MKTNSLIKIYCFPTATSLHYKIHETSLTRCLRFFYRHRSHTFCWSHTLIAPRDVTFTTNEIHYRLSLDLHMIIKDSTFDVFRYDNI